MKNKKMMRFLCLLLSTAMIAGCSPAEQNQKDTDTKIESDTAETVGDTVETAKTEETETVPVVLSPSAVETMENVLAIADYSIDLEAYAHTLLAKIREELTNEKNGIAYEFLGRKQISFLWPFSVLLEAVSALYECDTENEELREYYILLLDKFLPRYKSKSMKKYRAYASSTGDGDRYYDDNEWIVIEFVRAYRLLGNEEYLTYAKELAEYVYSGWVESSGGIRWIVGGDSCNTCSNGPAAVMSCMLYDETRDKYYLDWATKIYDWTREKLEDSDGTYFDNIKINDGSVDKAKYSYNTGTMIVSGVMLYRITGDENYLNQARKSAKGGDDEFFNKIGNRCAVKNHHPWFNSWLLEGFIEIFEADNEENWTPDYINDFYAVLETAVKRAGEGIYVGKSWNSKADSEIELIHQAGSVRAMAQMARLINKYAK